MHTVFEILCNTEKLREKYSSRSMKNLKNSTLYHLTFCLTLRGLASALIQHKRKASKAFNFLCAMH